MISPSLAPAPALTPRLQVPVLGGSYSIAPIFPSQSLFPAYSPPSPPAAVVDGNFATATFGSLSGPSYFSDPVSGAMVWDSRHNLFCCIRGGPQRWLGRTVLCLWTDGTNQSESD